MYRDSIPKSSKFEFYCIKDNKSQLTLPLLSNSAEKENLNCVTLYISTSLIKWANGQSLTRLYI